MDYDTENGATLQELPDREITNFGKRKKKLLLEIERKESKKLKRFQQLLKKMSQSPHCSKSRQSQNSANGGILLIVVSYLDNSSEEVISENI